MRGLNYLPKIKHFLLLLVKYKRGRKSISIMGMNTGNSFSKNMLRHTQDFDL